MKQDGPLISMQVTGFLHIGYKCSYYFIFFSLLLPLSYTFRNVNLLHLIIPSTQVCASIVLFISAALTGIRWINMITLKA